MKRLYFILIFFLNISYGESPTISVLLNESNYKVTITATTDFVIIDLEKNKIICFPLKNQRYIFTSYSKGIQITNIGYVKGPLKIKSNTGGKIKVNNHFYYGEIEIMNSFLEGKLLIINKIDLEKYLEGVISYEISPLWPEEAIKAQAVVARTYVLMHYQKNHNNKNSYVIDNTIAYQVYNGTLDNEKVKEIIKITEGEVIVYEDNLASVYYHSTCGGHTENIINVWSNKIFLPYLKGVVCNYCRNSPYSAIWEYKISFLDLEKKLNRAGYKIKGIKEIKLLHSEETNRVISLIIYNSNESICINANTFRSILGYNEFKSTIFDIKYQEKELVFRGQGWGHGVGMCQWGAKGMAEVNFNYTEIISYYFPNTNIKKWY